MGLLGRVQWVAGRPLKGPETGLRRPCSSGLREQLGSVRSAGWEAVRLSRPVVGTSGARGRRRWPFPCHWCETERLREVSGQDTSRKVIRVQVFRGFGNGRGSLRRPGLVPA